MTRANNIEALKAWVRKNGAWNNTHTSFICGICGKKFFNNPSAKSKYCSRVCANKATSLRTGEMAANWKGGKSYNNKCVDCGKHISFASSRCKSCAAKLMPHTSMKNKPWLRTRESIRKSLMRHPISSLEVKFQGIVDKYELPYKYVGNGKFFIENKNPDFINVNGEKKAVEVYARKHKEELRNVTIEDWKKNRREIFSKYGWEVVFFDEVELTEENVVSTLKGGVSHF